MYIDVVFFLSAACPVCWSNSFVSLINKIPSSDYLALSRKSSEWTPSDQQRKHAVTDAIVWIIPETLTCTCFGIYFPQYLRTVCDPDGFNFHSQMHNDNGKCAIEYLILASLGLCKSLNAVYSNVVVCEDRYFWVHRTTYIKGQPQSNPISDVIVMAFSTQDVNKAINWMLSDSPRTPKLILADAEASSNMKKIQDKTRILQAAMNAYSVGGRCLLGLILAGNMIVEGIS